MEKLGVWFLLAKCVKTTCGRVTFYIKIQVIYPHLYLKCYSWTGVFIYFATKDQLPGFSIIGTLAGNGLTDSSNLINQGESKGIFA